jgi:hypothetical protein
MNSLYPSLRYTTRSSSLRRLTSITIRSASSKSFATPPSPPRLSKDEQEIFENLQKQSTGAFSTPKSAEPTTTTTNTASTDGQKLEAQIKAKGEGEELHPHIRRGAKPEFEGDVNPKTGEVGGPKNEPQRWGTQGDYSYNGRVTDF